MPRLCVNNLFEIIKQKSVEVSLKNSFIIMGVEMDT